MVNFITKSFSELDHVVWPTDSQTRKYLQISLGIILTIALFLAFFGYIFTNGLSVIRSQFDHVSISPENSPATQQDLNTILNALGTGMIKTGTTLNNTGSVVPSSTGEADSESNGTDNASQGTGVPFPSPTL